MQVNEFLNKLNTQPQSISFDDTMQVIEANYRFTPTAFSNGETQNAADQNNGSCKVFAFAQLNNLTEELTLQCFGDYYRKDVLQNPQADDHQNIRNFIKSGWSGIAFEDSPLSAI
jgi:hypothetical protein